MEQITEYLITHNISYELLTLIAFMAIITTISNIFRYIFGLKSLGLYPSIIMALAFYLTGAKYGIIITILVISITLLTHQLFKKVRMHYLSRIALNYISIAITTILLFLIFDLINWQPLSEAVYKINPISLILLGSLSDHFIKLYVKKDLITTLRAVIETIFVALLGWSIIGIYQVKEIILNNILILPLLIPINIYIGQTTVLRFTEYFRFKKLIGDATGNSDRK